MQEPDKLIYRKAGLLVCQTQQRPNTHKASTSHCVYASQANTIETRNFGICAWTFGCQSNEQNVFGLRIFQGNPVPFFRMLARRAVLCCTQGPARTDSVTKSDKIQFQSLFIVMMQLGPAWNFCWHREHLNLASRHPHLSPHHTHNWALPVCPLIECSNCYNFQSR